MVMVRAALRLAARHVSAGRRGVGAARAAWRAGRSRCRPGRDPGGGRGVPELPRRRFVNLEPASVPNLDREQLRHVAWEIVGQRAASRPNGPDSAGIAGHFPG